MGKFNTPTLAKARNGYSPLTTSYTRAINHNGGVGALRDPKSELFLTIVNEFGGEKLFHENSAQRQARLAKLIPEVAVADPAWIENLVGWLRKESNLRSAPIILALTAAKALNDAGYEGVRKIVSNAILRADEPGEALAFWYANYGRKLPIGVKRGIADGVVRTYNEYSLGKYDGGDNKGFSFADVIKLVHPTPKDERQSALFKFAMDRRHDSSAKPAEILSQLNKRVAFLALSTSEKREFVTGPEGAQRLKDAGLTWENVGSTSGKGGLDAKAWEALIPGLGYMALIRNLRNFEDAGVSDEILDLVAKRLADPEEVARSRQLPFRFLSAARAIRSYRFAHPLERALDASLANIPSLKGRTLVMVDRSQSMEWYRSENTQMTWADTAALFGTALSMRAESADLVAFGSTSEKVDFHKRGSVLKTVESFQNLGGTETAAAIEQHLRGHDRVVLLTDDQHNGRSPYDVVPSNTPIYVWNFAGYKYGAGVSGPNRIYMGGLSDQSFSTIPLIETGRDSKWPWES
jgi:hypothetical protein